jgi:glucodextranase-like protein
VRAALLELRSSAEVAFDGSWRAVDAFVAGATQSPLVEEVRVRVTCAGWRLERHRPSGITLRGGRDGGTWSHTAGTAPGAPSYFDLARKDCVGTAVQHDLTRFQVLSDGTNAYLRVTLRTLVPTFGVLDGAQLLDVYVHVPGASPTSTAAAFASRDYTIAPPGAWSQRVEVQGFASPVWEDAAGGTPGTASVLAEQSDRTITIALPEAQFGTPGTGWGFAVALTGQDGFSADQARAFTSTAGAFTFGVCAAGGTAKVCSADPNTVPKAMDVITPSGADQATELDPTQGPVIIQSVTVP